MVIGMLMVMVMMMVMLMVMMMVVGLQKTQPTSGGAVTAVTNCCAIFVEPSGP